MNSIDSAPVNNTTATSGDVEIVIDPGNIDAKALIALRALASGNGGTTAGQSDTEGDPLPTGTGVKLEEGLLDGEQKILPDFDPLKDKLVEKEQQPQQNMGDDILRNLTAQSSQVQPQVVPQNGVSQTFSAAGDKVARVETIINQMVDRILVTDPLSGQQQQINIKIADHVLPTTEMQLWRGEGGQLHVNFSTQSSQAAQLLVDASQLLSQRLNDRLQLQQAAVVTVQTGQDGGMPQDGRSRQFQSLYELTEEQRK